MSIGIYAFLRIIFSALACPFGRALSDALPALQCRRRPNLSGTVYLVSGADRCSMSSVRACVSVRVVVCLASGTACAAACAVQAVRVRWGLGSLPAGYIGSAGGGAGHARDKIFQRKRRFLGFVLPSPPRLHKTKPI